MNIFISHSSTDFKVAEEVCNLLEDKGHKCFLAPRDIRSGYEYAEEIMNGIESSDVMLILMSKAANQSPHVLREVERAVSKHIPLIVYKLEEVELSKSMEYFLMSHQWVSAYAGATHAQVVRCINQFEKERDELGVQIEDIKKKGNHFLAVFGIALLLATVLLVGAVYLKAALNKKDAQEREEARVKQEQIDEKDDLAEEQAGGEVSGAEEEPVEEKPDGELNGDDAEPEKDDTESEKDDPEPNQEDIPVVEENTPCVEAGDTIVFGSYNGEPIEWRVLRVSANTNTAVLVSKHILTMKSFDVAESGSYNYYNGQDYWFEDVNAESAEVLRQIHGDNDWARSNIRTWLNSESENVKYEDQKPLLISTSEYKNGYDTEPGFLNNFTKEERAAILETEVKTNDKITMDKVYLLSTQELVWFEEADVSLVATPTAASLEQDASNWYEVNVSCYGVEDYCWWLRDSEPAGLACEAYLVGSSYSGCTIYTETVGLEGYGIRPAITIDLTAECFEIK